MIQSQRHYTLMPLMSSCHETGRQEREEGESSSLSTVMVFLPTELLWNPSIRTPLLLILSSSLILLSDLPSSLLFTCLPQNEHVSISNTMLPNMSFPSTATKQRSPYLLASRARYLSIIHVVQGKGQPRTFSTSMKMNSVCHLSCGTEIPK